MTSPRVLVLMCGAVAASAAGEEPREARPFTCISGPHGEIRTIFELETPAEDISVPGAPSPGASPSLAGVQASPFGAIPEVTAEDIFIWEDTERIFTDESNYPLGYPFVLADASHALIDIYGDVFDLVGFFLNFDPPSPIGGRAFRLYNGVRGLGGMYDYRPYHGMEDHSVELWVVAWNEARFAGGGQFWRAAQRLIAHEYGHRYGVDLLPLLDGRHLEGVHGIPCYSSNHWNLQVDAQGSVMVGPDWVGSDPAVWTTTGSVCVDFSPKSPDIQARYNYLDLYLMGYVSPEELDTLPSELRYMDEACPWGGYFGPISTFTSADIIAANGPRVPSHVNARKNFRMAWVMIHLPGSPPTADQLDNVVNILNQWTANYSWSTLGRGTINNTLRPTVSALDPTPVLECSNREMFFEDKFENGVNGWTVALSGDPDNPYDWVQTDTLPVFRAGTGWYCPGGDDDCSSGAMESAVHYLFSPEITVPADASQPTLKVTHYMATETGYDGGNLKIRVNGGAWQLVPPTAFFFNPYNVLLTSELNGNPLGGQPGWSGVAGTWGTSLVDLSEFISGGETIQLAFAFGKDECNGADGWYIDKVLIYNCACQTAANCDRRGLFCHSASCVGGACQPAVNPCGDDFCEEATETCVPAVFWDDFENGNVRGWDLVAPDSTATEVDWVLGDPYGTSWKGKQAQPEAPFQGLGCAFTGQSISFPNDSVLDGAIYLESPRIDLSGARSAELRFARWFFQRNIDDDPNDFFVAEVSSNDGVSWVNLETLGPADVANSWTQRTFLLENYVALTDAVRIRFGASNGVGIDDVIEAAVDDVVVTAEIPIPTVSHWGLAAITLLILTAATLLLNKRNTVNGSG